MNWVAEKLADHCETITKGTTPTSLGMNFVESGIPFVRVQNLVGGSVRFEKDDLFIDSKTHEALRRSKIYAGDVLLSIAGTIGRCAIVPQDAEELNCNQAVAIIRPRKSIDRRFFMHWISSRAATDQIRQSKVTATISNLSLGQIGELRIPLPPLDEQKRIAAILDQADELRRKRQRALDRLNQLGQAIFHEMFGNIANGQRTHSFAEIATIQQSLVDPKLPQFRSELHVGPEHIEGGKGVIHWHNVRTAKEDNVISGKNIFAPGNVIFSKIRPYLNKVAIADRTGLCSADMYVIQPIPETSNAHFLHMLLMGRDFLSYAETCSNRANIPKLNRKQVEGYQFYCPPIEEQHQLALRLKELERAAEVLRDAKAHSSSLFACLQHRAFRGEL